MDRMSHFKGIIRGLMDGVSRNGMGPSASASAIGGCDFGETKMSTGVEVMVKEGKKKNKLLVEVERNKREG